MGNFEGFSNKFFTFFKDLSKNNNREWFTENKQRYEDEVVTPVLAFITDMEPLLKKISPHFIASPKKVGGSMFRIHRDVRFSKDKKPYKENAGCQFRHKNGKDAHAPGFYLHLEPGKIFYGGGIWMPSGEPLRKIRNAISEKQSGWGRVSKDRKMIAEFEGVRGESLKRPPKDFSPDHKYIDDIKRKTFFVMHDGDMKSAAKPEFVNQVAESFKTAKPLMRFLCKALDQEF